MCAAAATTRTAPGIVEAATAAARQAPIVVPRMGQLPQHHANGVLEVSYMGVMAGASAFASTSSERWRAAATHGIGKGGAGGRVCTPRSSSLGSVLCAWAPPAVPAAGGYHLQSLKN